MAEPVGLDRRRPHGQHVGLAGRHEAAQIDQNIDAVGMNTLRRRARRKREQRDIGIDVAADTIMVGTARLRAVMCRIGGDLEPAPVMRGVDRQGDVANRVIAKIG